MYENSRSEQWRKTDSLESLHGGYSSFQTRMDGLLTTSDSIPGSRYDVEISHSSGGRGCTVTASVVMVAKGCQSREVNDEWV